MFSLQFGSLVGFAAPSNIIVFNKIPARGFLVIERAEVGDLYRFAEALRTTLAKARHGL